VLAFLQHVFLANSAHEAAVGIDEPAISQSEVAPDQLIKSRFLSGVFPVAKPFFYEFAGFGIGKLPGALSILQFLVAKTDAKRVWKMVFHNGAVHFFEIFSHMFSS
jgi:hypothetical protein